MRPTPSACRRAWCGLLCAAALAWPLAGVQAAEAQRWDLRDLYATPATWDSALAELRARVPALEGLRATLAPAQASAAGLLRTLTAISDAQKTLGRLATYASLKGDEDLRDAPAQERRQRTQALGTLLDEKTSWLAPAIQALGAERVRDFLAAEPALQARFDRLLKDMLRNAPHTLDPEGEAVLAASGTVLAQPNNVFQQLAEAELPLARVTLSDGKRVTLGFDAYERLRTLPVRADRKRVFDAFWAAVGTFEGTFGANLATQVQGEVFTARARRFDGTLQASLFRDDMPPAVYRMLVQQANAALPTLHRYLRLRARMLGVQGPLAYYDSYPPLVRRAGGERYGLERSKAIVLQALAPLGNEYLGLLKQGFAGAWMDSHPRPGKASGAYVSGHVDGVHPYVLLNHNDDFESLSTLAHEWGHAVHTLLAQGSQPFEKADYSTFIAESASIGNEMLLSDHLVAHAATRQDKLFFLAQALESIRTTFFRQVMFAEFQLAIHEEVEQGRPLSGQRLSELYCGIERRYYGQAQGVMNVAPAYCVEWARIPHFYYGYYVWQYATSMVGAAQFAADIAAQGEPARARFIKLLKAGGSDDPYLLYKQAGIDLAEPAPYQALVARMNRLIDEFEALAAQGERPKR